MGTEDVILGERAARREEPALSGAKGSRRSSSYHNGGILRLRLRMTAREHTATHSGQALIVAVLVLFAVATLAALFTAIISSQVAQTGRHADMVQLRNVAEAGLRWANEQLSYGIDGADWRPSQKVYRTGGGEVTIDISYGPNPTQVQSRFIRIVASAVFPDNPFLRHTILALKPLLLTDYARFITDRYETNQPAALGVAGVEMGGAPREGLNGGNYVFHVSGPIRSNTDLTFYGTSEIDLFTRDYASWHDLGLLRDDTIEVSGELSSKDWDPLLGNLSKVSLWVDGTQRAIDLFNPQQTEVNDYENGFPAWRVGYPVPNTWRVLANLSRYSAPGPLASYTADPKYLAPPRIRPPLIDSVHPDLQTNRYLALTRDSGDWSLPTSAGFVNTGQYGWGWTNASGGIYIDNSQDIQYKRSDGTHDLEKLRLNWVGSVGVHDGAGDNRAGGGSPPGGPADWWDKTGRYYSPPGVEIILHGEAQCPWVELIRHDPKPVFASVPMDLSNPTTYYYWEKPLGSVITNDTPYYPQGARCLPPLMTAPRPSAVGKRAVMPFPPNGVIYAEGNIRIRGMMPPARYEPYTYADFDRYSATQGAPRRFDLQVVSGGTIYIEGDLLTPGPDGARLARMDRNGNATRLLTLDDDRLWGSRIALLARDYVCLNTTALFPRPVDTLQVRTVTDSGGAKTNYWYNDLQPIYPKDKQYAYMHFQGPQDDDVNSTAGAIAWDTAGRPHMDTTPASIDFIYNSLRFTLPDLTRRPDDVRLFVGHSAWYQKDGTTTPAQPPEKTTDDTNDVSVDLQGSMGPATGTAEVWSWIGAGTDRYTFWRQSLADPAGKDESEHWYTSDSHLEMLPNEYQAMSVAPTGNDLIRLASRVWPMGIIDPDTSAVTDWGVKPRELGYILGPVAIAPPRWVDGDVTNPKVPLEVQVQALIYAQNGSWFIIPGPWFNEDANYLTAHPAWDTEYPGYHEPLNIQLQFFGAISENMPAPIGDVADWTSKWSGTKQYAETYGSAALRYYYDPLLRTARVMRDPIDPRIMRGTPRFPRMPLTPDLVVWGERISGQAGG